MDSHHLEDDQLPISVRTRIDDTCEHFESSIKAGGEPNIENCLEEFAADLRGTLLRELLHVELSWRRRRGEEPTPQEYQTRFADFSDLIAETFQLTEKSSGAGGRVYTPGQRIGRYRIQRVLGKGAFGWVYLAHDDDLNRSDAIKIPRPERVASSEDIEALLAEARLAARLDHPNIVPVHDVGRTSDGLCYVVSKFIEGSNLAKRFGDTRLSASESAELVATVAETLHYAHRQGVVHRDIKPANILIDTTGKPYITDFGLALKEMNHADQTGVFAGTPAYMSPEQTRGEGHRVDGRSDVFSLGVVLYELLTGRRPFQGDTLDELCEQITTVEPRAPGALDETIPTDLERICLKALAKRAADRYASAKDLAEDIHYWQTRHTETAKHKDRAPTPSASRPPHPELPQVTPRGLRSFDVEDADFFLQLLPGPRDRNGLPESIRFWKTRLEQMDAGGALSVGLMYGPSGCGKSSLVKAGLLPRLADHVMPIYLAATAEQTEARLLQVIRNCFLDLPSDLGLSESLAALRRGQGVPAGYKVVILLDQFEQWLHANREDMRTELLHALRHCDGQRIQCLLMVRDDFWMLATRFMQQLEIDLLQGQNMNPVDLFDMDHARKVLAAFGRAYGTLAAAPGELTKDNRAFIRRAVSALATEGKVISVRLALFAEMVKNEPWTTATLKKLGGAEGVAITFLEETFGARTASPLYRLHRKAIQAVLKSLLPEHGADIRGSMRSQQQLLTVSGYAGRPQEFRDLIRILDGDTRLLTPVDPEVPGAEQQSPAATSERYYQLTHDYLVPSLRDWLTRRQRATWRGRAELRLAERSAHWNARPERRRLPEAWEFLGFCLLTKWKGWDQPQRHMMRRAAKYQLIRGCLALAVLVLVVTMGVTMRNATRARGLVERLLDADITQVPDIVEQIADYRGWAMPRLQQIHSDPSADAEKKLRASLALLAMSDQGAHADCLSQRMIETKLDAFLAVSQMQPLEAQLDEFLAPGFVFWREPDANALRLIPHVVSK